MAKIECGMKLKDFKYRTAWREGLDFYEQTEGKKTALIFLRYIGCPPCHLTILELSEAYSQFQARDAKVFVVLQSAPETIREMMKEGEIPFDIICDPSQELYHSLEIGNRPDNKGQRSEKWHRRKAKCEERGLVHGKYEGNEEQAPAAFVLRPDKTVSYAHYGTESVDVPEVEELLQLVDQA